MNSKPTAIVFAQPFEGRISYFLAGLSHHYKLKIYYVTNKRFRFVWQIFYKWQYSSDTQFIGCHSLQDILRDSGYYDAAFVQEETFENFYVRFESQKLVLDFLRELKHKTRDLYWLEIGEQSWYYFGRPEFWDLVSGVVKGQVFKPEYEYLLRDPEKMRLYQCAAYSDILPLKEENMRYDSARYRHKVFPFPFTPTITDPKDLPIGKNRIYDFAANTKPFGNGALRTEIIRAIEKDLGKDYKYSIEYWREKWVNNVPIEQRQAGWYLRPSEKLGELLFRLRYGKYFYAMPLYFHNIAHSRCYLGLGWTFSSLRTADAWGVGTVLINFSFAKCDYGIPVEDGYNYVSIGERDEMTDDNKHFKTQHLPHVVDKMEAILSDRVKQKKIIENGKKVYEEYFSSPQQFAKKIFIDKI